jgi:geranylgeranylglycerol-phosphate geranylgeranyltransferase
VRGLLELTRPGNTFAAGVLTFVGAFVAGGAFASPVLTGAAVGATWLATAAGMVINDYFDREIDRINKPGRPIPRGAVSARGALSWSGVLFLGAVVLAVQLPVLAIAIAVVNLVALVLYTRVFKGTPGFGNLVVAYLGGSTFLFGGAAVGRPLAAGVLFALAVFSTFAREVVKDVEDVAGDEAEGLRTLPLVVGSERALRIAAVALAVAVLASPLPYVWGLFGVWYLVVVLPVDGLFAYASWRSFSDPEAGQRLLKYGMYLATVAFVVGRLTAR